MRFVGEITLTKNEAFDVLQILTLAADALGESGAGGLRPYKHRS